MRSPSAFYHRLVIFRLNSEERTGMVAYGTFFRRLYGFASEAAVRAHPEFLFVSLEQFAVFHIGKKNFISSFMLLFNFADFGHEESNLRKTLFFLQFQQTPDTLKSIHHFPLWLPFSNVRRYPFSDLLRARTRF